MIVDRIAPQITAYVSGRSSIEEHLIYGFEPLTKELILPLNKPDSSVVVWSSTANEDDTSEWTYFCSDWQPCEFYYKLIQTRSIKLLEINNDRNTTNWDKSLTPYKQQLKIGGKATKYFDSSMLDWEKIYAEGFDGVHLTIRAASYLYHNGFYAWDVESTCWFNLDWCRIEGPYEYTENQKYKTWV